MFVKYFYIVAVCSILLSQIWAKEFTFYWNIPTFACSRVFNLTILNVTQYGIIQNVKDNFRGDQVSILNYIGMFPAILENAGNQTYQNGGVPQNGNLEDHLKKFKQHIMEKVPHPDNSGLIIIELEFWRPVYEQNFDKLQLYRDLSIKLAQEANPHLSTIEVEDEARRLFTESAKLFMSETIKLGKQLRPNAKWGYYGLPHCFNGNVTEDCDKSVQDENDSTQWLYDISDVMFPSIYATENINSTDRTRIVKGRIREALRLSMNTDRSVKPLVIAYHRYKFTDSLQYLNESENVIAFETAKETGADGVVLWGAWKDLNTIDKCTEFYDYVENVLGPSAKKFVSIVTSAEDNETSETSTQSSGNNYFGGKTCLLLVLLQLIISINYRQ